MGGHDTNHQYRLSSIGTGQALELDISKLVKLLLHYLDEDRTYMRTIFWQSACQGLVQRAVTLPVQQDLKKPSESQLLACSSIAI